jgi:hypothetical protein
VFRDHRPPARWVPALAGLAVTAIACTSETERATDLATAQVRENARQALDVLEEIVADPKAGRGQDLVDQIRRRLAAGPDVITFDTEVHDHGSVTLRLAFHARGESGGGLTYEAVVARLCVELTAEPGPPPVAELRDTTCSPRLPGSTGSAGNVDVTVGLRER